MRASGLIRPATDGRTFASRRSAGRRAIAFVAATGAFALALPVAGAAAVAPTRGAHVHPAERHLHDPRLEREIRDAKERMARNGRAAAPMVSAEVLTSDTSDVARAARALGADVQGVVDGALVQVRAPVTAIDSLASLGSITEMQYPQLSGRVPESFARSHPGATPMPAVTDSGVIGEEVTATNAAAWHAAGITGSGVKVGIVDYFDLDLWSTTEHGPVPDAAHQFCRDTMPIDQGLCAPDGTIARGLAAANDAFRHGVAVSEVVHDMAPDAQLYVASVATTADLQAAVNWFASRGVTVITRSLGSAYDGPGDGTGPLANVVNSAAARGMVWFNSGGNDAEDAYLTRRVSTTLSSNGGSYVDFAGGRESTADTWLRVTSPECFFMDGVRWSNDWRLPAAQRTDYSIEFWEPIAPTSGGEHSNPTRADVQPIFLGDQGGTGPGGNVIDRSQRNGASPLEASDIAVCPTQLQLDGYYATFIRIRRNALTPVGTTPDRVEVAIAGRAFMELGLSDRAGSAAKPVVDSRSSSLLSVGAVELIPSMRLDDSDPLGIAYYSSQGPTTDGRVKPDIASFSGMQSVTYGSTFSGTSSASPTAAGFAALVLQAGLAVRGAPLAAMVRHLVIDHAPRGLDNAYGWGITKLPAPPPAAPTVTPGRYVPATRTARILDTRRATHIGPGALTGPYRAQTVLDLKVLGVGGVPTSGVTAVALNITSVNSATAGYVQALPTLRAAVGRTSTANISVAGTTTANFAIVPVGSGGRVSLYLQAGGDVVVDVAGWFTTAGVDAVTGTATAGRLTPLAVPEHWRTVTVAAGTTPLLTRPSTTAVPAGAAVQALVVTVSASKSTADGYVRLFPTGADPTTFTHSNLNFVRGRPATNTAIVPVGTNGRISMYVYGNRRDSVTLDVEVVGWITSATAAASVEGTFVPVAPFRAYDSRTTTPFTAKEVRTVVVSQGPVPATAIAVSTNVTVTGVTAAGMLQLRPGPAPAMQVRTVTYSAAQTVASAAVSGVLRDVSAATVNVFLQQAGHAIIDVNGYFVGPPSIT